MHPQTSFRPNPFRPHLEVLETRCCPTAVHPAGNVHPAVGGQANQVRIVQDDTANLRPVTCAAPERGMQAAAPCEGVPAPTAKQVTVAKRRRRHRVKPHRGHPVPLPPPVPGGTLPGGVGTAGPTTATDAVLVNGQPLSPATVQGLLQFGVQARPGSYWYDNRSGAAGFTGQGTLGFIPAGLDLGGPLQADASNGTSGVFINGRQATLGEVAFLQSVTGFTIPPGRYFLDANGDAGVEGGPVAVNLLQLANQRGRSSPLTTYDRTGISVLADGNFVGVLDHEGNSVTFD
jgi:hypothetical protein